MNTETTRILGIPVSLAGLINADARLRGFEPENPSMFVPRSFGAGWDLNIGAVAVKLGIIRPDDSLPDLAEHIPPATITALRVAPVLGAAAVAVIGVRAALTHDHLPSNWDITMKPTRWHSGPMAMAAPVALSVGSGIWATVAGRQKHADPVVDVAAAAQTIGLQAMSLILIAAATQHADNPEASRVLPAAGLVTLPVVSTGIMVTTVRGALRNLDRKLRA